MSGFSADWLALRADADARVRCPSLITRAVGVLSESTATPSIMDLGAGTGATMRALAPLIDIAHRWTLVDADRALLDEAERLFASVPLSQLSPPKVLMVTAQHDLVAAPAPWTVIEGPPPSLLTASALFDLASQDFVEALADACAQDGVPLLAMLSFDGVLEVSPHHPFDGAMIDAFNRHQRGEKTFGRALGPDAVAALSSAFRARGFDEEAASTPWVLEKGRDDELMAAMLDGWAGAAAEVLPGETATITAWQQARHATTDRLLVGHRDQLFIPRA